MSCARCGCGIYKTEEFISLNKVWHKYCFTCFQCNKRLDKDSAKIFQGELFCECCYTSVIEQLFEVISAPSLNKPCKVVSTPSCAVSKTFLPRLQNCNTCLVKVESCRNKEYCFPTEKKNCIQRTVQSCSCIPNQNNSKNEYCFSFPIPREVANYYNRSHMRTKACKNPISCCYQPQCPACNCRKKCSPEPRCPPQVRILTTQCCCNSCTPRCGSNPPKRCCCSKPPPPCTPVFTKGCICCLPQDSDCSEPCSPPQRCTPPCSSPPPCETLQCCQRRPCGSKCPPSYCQPKCCPPPNCPPPVKCCQPAQCCPPRCPPVKCHSPVKCCQPVQCCPPRCPPVKWCPPQQCCPTKTEGYGEQPCLENSNYYCKRPTTCCDRPKYCGCGNLNPCNCKISQIKAQCTACCIRCGQKVYAAEKILVSSGAYHTSCFTCYCCNKCLDVKNVFEGCGEIYCKQCYNHFFGVQYYGFGVPNC